MGGLSDPWTLSSTDKNKLHESNSGFIPKSLNPFPSTHGSKEPTVDALKFPVNPSPNQRKFIIFDHSDNHTTFIFSSMQPPTRNVNLKETSFAPKSTNLDVPSNTGMVKQSSICNEATAYNECVCQEEDTDEIDALLFSDWVDDNAQCSTWQFPLIATVPEEEVASSGGPTKRRRLHDKEESDAALADTASSAFGEDDLSSCIKGHVEWVDDKERDTPVSSSGSTEKRDKIHEAVCILRGVIPGCKGERDAVAVLDAAISYLKSLELKANAFGIAL